jgi:hypothetical protein
MLESCKTYAGASTEESYCLGVGGHVVKVVLVGNREDPRMKGLSVKIIFELCLVCS